MLKNKLNQREITQRVSELRDRKGVTDYYIWKNTQIPRSTYYSMIKNKSRWKMEYLLSIADLLNENFNWLVFGQEDYSEKKIRREYEKIKKENLILREEVETYRIIKKEFLEKLPSPLVEVEIKNKKEIKK